MRPVNCALFHHQKDTPSTIRTYICASANRSDFSKKSIDTLVFARCWPVYKVFIMTEIFIYVHLDGIENSFDAAAENEPIELSK